MFGMSDNHPNNKLKFNNLIVCRMSDKQCLYRHLTDRADVLSARWGDTDYS